MKFIKDIQNFILDSKLKKFRIFDYIINEDGSIDCNQNVYLHSMKLGEIPNIKFNKINGCYSINLNNLTSLKNCPKYISKWFNCSENKLTSLEFGPEFVGGQYLCAGNELTTLKGCVEEVHSDFICFTNKLTSLEFCPMEVKGDFNCSFNELEYLDRSPLIEGNLYCKRMFKSEPEFNGSCNKLVWK